MDDKKRQGTVMKSSRVTKWMRWGAHVLRLVAVGSMVGFFLLWVSLSLTIGWWVSATLLLCSVSGLLISWRWVNRGEGYGGLITLISTATFIILTIGALQHAGVFNVIAMVFFLIPPLLCLISATLFLMCWRQTRACPEMKREPFSNFTKREIKVWLIGFAVYLACIIGIAALVDAELLNVRGLILTWIVGGILAVLLLSRKGYVIWGYDIDRKPMFRLGGVSFYYGPKPDKLIEWTGNLILLVMCGAFAWAWAISSESGR